MNTGTLDEISLVGKDYKKTKDLFTQMTIAKKTWENIDYLY